jgi:hypothetical protein
MSEPSSPVRLRLAQQFLVALGQGDISSAVPMLAPSASLRVPGHHAFAGEFTSPEEICKHLHLLAERTVRTFDVEKWEDWLVGDRHVASIAEVRAQEDVRLYAGRQLILLRFNAAHLIDGITIFFEDLDAIARFAGQ